MNQNYVLQLCLQSIAFTFDRI